MNISQYISRFIQAGVTIVFIVTIYLIVTFSVAQKNVVSIYEDRLIPIIQLTKISDYYNNNIIFCFRAFNQHEITNKEASKIIADAITQSNQYWSDYLKTYLTPEENSIAITTNKNKLLLDSKLEEIEKLILSNQTAQQNIILNNLIAEIKSNITTTYSKQLQSLLEIQKKEAKNLEIQTQQLYSKIILFAVLVCLLCLAVILLLYRRI